MTEMKIAREGLHIAAIGRSVLFLASHWLSVCRLANKNLSMTEFLSQSV